VAKRILAMHKDPTSVWGKNKTLETFWQSLANGKKVVIIYTNGKHQYTSVPTNYIKFYEELGKNKEVEAVLSSNRSQDAYERLLYPKAKDQSVEHVIQNYKKYFQTKIKKKVRYP